MQPSDAAAASVPGLIWGVPFAGVLLSIALIPAVAPRFWHRRMALVSGFWTLALLVPQAAAVSPASAAALAWHVILIEYLPFITLLLALYTAGGGVMVRGGLPGTPAGNTALLALGTLLAGVMGTTGAAMVLIHPLLRANAHRQRKMHLAVFFILLVANAGGALSPLGDPPLYLGYLRGVPFFWPLRNLGLPLAVLAGALLALFWTADKIMARSEPAPEPPERLHIRGWGNAALVLLVGATVLGLGLADVGSVTIGGQRVEVMRLISTGVFLIVTLLSALLTPRAIRQWNEFSWHPMIEVAVLFVAILITIEPVLEILQAGADGPLAAILHITRDAQGQPRPAAFFWLTGTLSAFLDNAPTYLVFFDMARIHASNLSVGQTAALDAVSAGAVFFGGLTYIGNAPNMMVRGVAAHRGVRMPGFIGYTAIAALVTMPVFAGTRPSCSFADLCPLGGKTMTYLVAADLPAVPAGERFRTLLREQGILQMPGAQNGMAALQAKAAGFRAVYLSGAAMTAQMGLPDLGVITGDEVCFFIRQVTRAAGLPVLVDGDTGYGEALNVMHMVRSFEDAGAAAVHIEDQLLPKKCGHLNDKKLADAHDMAAKVAAAVKARRHLFVIARTDAAGSEGMDGAVARAKLYLQAGADAIFPEALTSAEMFREFARRVDAPLLANMTEFGRTPFFTAVEFEQMGYRMVIWPVSSLRVANKAQEELYAAIRRDGGTQNMVDRMQTRAELYATIGYHDYEALDATLVKTVVPEGILQRAK